MLAVRKDLPMVPFIIIHHLKGPQGNTSHLGLPPPPPPNNI